VLVSDLPALRDHWYPVVYSSAVTAAPAPVRLFARDYVVWRPEDGSPPRAAADRCPHRAARLSQGWVQDGCLVCPYHGWRFGADGACVDIPSADADVPIPPRARVDAVAVGERYGLVWMCVGDPGAGIPRLREADDESYVLIHELLEVWHASAPRIVDNALDVSHVAWVHRASVGSSAHPRLGEYAIEREGSVLRFSVPHTASLNAEQQRNTGIYSPTTTRVTHVELVEPLVFRGAIEYVENGLVHVLFKTCTPIDDDTTLMCQFVARNDRPDAARARSIAEVDLAVQKEDRALLEGIESDFPIDVTSEVHTRADRMTIEYRRVLADLMTAAPR
jgi:phenylpropionate dioxygenase-like ring-hydroxylating dioxygenase large terminal subunit